MLLFNQEWAEYLIDLVKYARQSIYISTFKAEISSSPKARVLNQLFDEIGFQAKKGLEVKMLLNWNAQKKRVPRTNLKAQRFLLSHGAAIRHLKMNRCVHSKLFIVDQGVMVLGSHNMSLNSTIANFETSYIVTDPSMLATATTKFLTLFDEGIEF